MALHPYTPLPPLIKGLSVHGFSQIRFAYLFPVYRRREDLPFKTALDQSSFKFPSAPGWKGLVQFHMSMKVIKTYPRLPFTFKGLRSD